MNHKQINNLDEGDVLELKEDYVYITDFGKQTIKKGTRLTLLYPFLGGWRFEFDRFQRGFFSYHVSLGRSRLLKLKVNKVQSSNRRVKE